METLGINVSNTLGQQSPETQQFYSVEQRILDDATFTLLELVFRMVLQPLIGILTICANILNIAIYTKMGLSDGVSLSFVLLAVSDGLYALIITLSGASFIFETFASEGAEVAVIVAWTCALAKDYPKSYSLIIIVVINVVRCLCVTLPFKVKELFTTKRQVAAIFVFSSIATAVLTMKFPRARIINISLPYQNMTMLVYTGINSELYSYFSNIFYYSGFAIVVVCVVILTFSLRKSSSFREQSTGGTDSKVSEAQLKAKRREIQIVKVLTMVSVFLIISFLPAIVNNFVLLLLDVEPPTGRYQNFARFILMVDEVFLLLNAGANIILYYSFNSRFKETCLNFFCKE